MLRCLFHYLDRNLARNMHVIEIPLPVIDRSGHRDHLDAVGRAGIDTEIATGALVGNHGMHRLGGADNGIHRAGLNALGAADALIFVDKGDLFDRHGGLVTATQRLGLDPHQIGNFAHGGLATGYALVDLIAVGERLGVGFAAGIAALATLGLGQQGIELIDDGVCFHMKLDGGKAQDNPERQRQQGEHQNGKENMDHGYILIRPVKPIKASDIRPAVIMAIDTPRNGAGTSAATRRSRMAANRINTSEKPVAAPKP